MTPEVLNQRTLNRTLLLRQGLLERTADGVAETVEQLVGLQAQVPENPYVALWSRLEGFEPTELSDLVAGGGAVRAQLMRSTIHLVTARDCLYLAPLTQPVLAATFGRPWAGKLAGVDPLEVAEAGVRLLSEQPLTRAQLSEALAPHWPEADPLSLAYAVTFNSALVQVPPRGTWRASAQATWAPAEAFLGKTLDPAPSLEELVLRYLRAFGPATVADMRTWSRLTGLRAVVEGLRPGLRTFRDQRGRELFDDPGAPLGDPAAPAPPRFLPEYDNVTLSHDDRYRVLAGIGPGSPFPRGISVGGLLVDGFYRANWKLTEDDGVPTLTVDRFAARPGDPPGTVEAITAEGEALLGLLAASAPSPVVRFEPAP